MLKDYTSPYTNGLIGKEKVLDELVVSWLTTFVEDKTKQELVFGWRGYPLEKYFKDLKKIFSSVWKRNETIYHLDFLEVSLERIEKIPNLKKIWKKDSKLRDLIGDYKRELEFALYEFNKQFILHRLEHARYGFVVDFDRVEHRKLIKDIREKFDESAYRSLEDKYYDEALTHFKLAGRYWEKLNKHNVGKLFILQVKDVQKLHSERRKLIPYKL